jgi:exopolysaccharide biosynthesis polyprenyl glycosylphosphotransferase
MQPEALLPRQPRWGTHGSLRDVTAETTRQAPWALDSASGAKPDSAAGSRLEIVEEASGAIPTSYGRRDYLIRRGLAGADFAGILLSGLLAFAVSPARPGVGEVLWLLPTLPAWLLLFRVYGLYERDRKRISQPLLDDLPSLFHAFVMGTLLLWLYYRLVPTDPLVFAEVLVFGVSGITSVSLLRWIARRSITNLFGPERVLLIGVSPLTSTLVRKMRQHPEYGLEPVGAISRDGLRPDVPLPVLGRLEKLNLAHVVAAHAVERVMIAQTEVDEKAMLGLLHDCTPLQVKASVLPRHVDAMGPSLEVDDIEGVTVLGFNPLVLSRSSRFLKRAVDVLGAGVGLLLLSPLMAIAAVAIKLNSAGPIFFRQERVGRRGRRFRLVKFRTMFQDAEARTAELWSRSNDPHWLKLESDPRITPVGRALRLASLDELPQLWNVLRGDMSLVGPRPLIASEDCQIEGWARTRLDLAPGVTGLWQVLGRTNIPFEEMVKLDNIYVTNWSLWLDIKLLLRTIPAVLTRRGAN